MPQVLTEDLLDILASRFQAAAHGYRCRVEIDHVIPGSTEIGAEVNLAPLYGTISNHPDNTHSWPEIDRIIDGTTTTGTMSGLIFPTYHIGVVVDLGAAFDVTYLLFDLRDGADDHPEIVQYSTDGSTWTSLMEDGVGPSTWGGVGGARTLTPTSPPINARYWRCAYRSPNANNFTFNEWEIIGEAVEIIDPEIGTASYRPKRAGRDLSRRMAASQLTVEIPRELVGASLLAAIETHSPIRLYEWYGVQANEVRTFTGLIDSIKEGRDPRNVAITARDRMKILIVQTFSATAPQGADEDGAVRTEANGVYLEQDADAIVDDILDRAGWPTADRDIAATGYALDEYIISDGASWAEAIIGENALTGLTGYDAWVDELGIFHFAPMLATAAPDSDTDPVPDYSYIVSAPGADNLESRNVLRLDHEIDDYDLKTRVKVRGNLATAVAAFTELWHTNKFNKPVGLWWDPTDADFLRVLDRGTKKIYRLRQSDREKVGAGIWPLDVSGDVTHPLGLSGDPADSDVFWVLEAAWRTGAGNNASIHKYDASSGAHLAEYSLPDGQWSDIKASSSFLWLTNYGTNKLHKRSKADGTNITTYDGPTVNGNVQQKPTGVAIDGTTLLTFWDGKARFLLTDESAPETLDPSTPLLDGNGIIRTAGSKIFGGEMDTATDAHLFACHDELGIVWKFALTEPSTDEVFSEVVDTDLEDSLGLLAGLENREHDTHPGDADHPFEVRRATLTLEKTITNLAQATETALRALDELAHRREVVDFGVVGHPGHQRGDLHQLTDPITGIDALYVLDTYRDNMDDRGYLGTVAYVPYDPSY
jgi:hypothetical protein